MPNSIVNLPKAIPFLQTHRTVHAFLDNDEAGKRAVQCLYLVCKEVIDQSAFYRNHKDLNDYWRGENKPKNQVVETKATVQFKWQILTNRKLTLAEISYFRELKEHNNALARLSNYIQNKDSQLYVAIVEFLRQSRELYNRFF